MGFVAHYQQFDPEATHVGPATSGRHEAPPDQDPTPQDPYGRSTAPHDAPTAQYAPHADQNPGYADQPGMLPDQYPAYPGQYGTDLDPAYADQSGALADQYPVYADQYEIRADQVGMDAGPSPDQYAYPDRYGTYPEQSPPADDSTAVFAGALIDLSAPRRAPVEHRRPGRTRKVVLALAALAVMLAGGTGYVLLRGTDPDNSAAASARRSTPASAPPSAAPGDTSVPNGEPVHTAPTSPAATSATAPPPPSAVATTAPAAIPVIPRPVTAQPVRPTAPVRTSAPAPITAPATPTPTGGSPAATPLTATYSYRTDGDNADPITGYQGTIRTANPGDTPAAWTAQLTVPSANTITIETGDVTTTRDGTSVTFHPSAGTLPAHGSATFTFTLSAPLSTLPAACTINGAPCA
jgi:cellulose binding protein with CBM2 domain